VLMIDDVLDPGNLGAIIRSAYFLGVDAIAICNRTCAPITPTALKASAGAAEAIPIFNVDNPTTFLKNCSAVNWKIYCGTTPQKTPIPTLPSSEVEPQQIRYTLAKNGSVVSASFNPLGSSAVLVLGGEGKGLRSTLTYHAWAFVEVLPQINVNECGVDSLNVSVAAALLCADMLRPRPPIPVAWKLRVTGPPSPYKSLNINSEETNKNSTSDDNVSESSKVEGEAEAGDREKAARLF